jgi:hypothetical protein
MDPPREGDALPEAHRGRFVRVISSRPLAGYFVMAFALSWAWFGLALGAWDLPLQGPAGFVGTLVGPCLAGFTMTALLRGRAGVIHLLRGSRRTGRTGCRALDGEIRDALDPRYRPTARAEHVTASVATGTYCRYRPRPPVSWSG